MGKLLEIDYTFVIQDMISPITQSGSQNEAEWKGGPKSQRAKEM